MARESSSLFMPNPPMESQHRHPLFSSHDFPPISGVDRFGSNTHFNSDHGANNYQNHNSLHLNQANSMKTQPIHSLLDTQKCITGVGELTWLSSMAGLITCTNGNVISFQLKDFCDHGITDLLSFLRVGFFLTFSAIHQQKKEYTATVISPVHGKYADIVFQDTKEIDLEAVQPTPANAKLQRMDEYEPTLELSAYHAILGAFKRHGDNKFQLSSVHYQISNCGDEKLCRYVGTSSMKRRKFVERRTHLFCLQNDDSIFLQHPAVYEAVVLLSSYLLRRGGVTSIQCLYDHFLSNDVHQSIKNHIGIDRQGFLNLLTFHSWTFSIFPGRQYVSARRNLPTFDYCSFIEENLPLFSMPRHQSGYAQQQQQQSVQRTMPVPLENAHGMMGRSDHHNVSMQQQQQPVLSQTTELSINGNSTMYLAGSESVGSQNKYYWNPVFNLKTWSSGQSSSSQSQEQLVEKITVDSLVGNELFDKTLLNSGLDNFLRQNDSKTSICVQADETSIGLSNCTCQCICGRGGVGSGDRANFRLNVGTIGSSRGLPTINPGVSNFGPIGFKNNRPLSVSTVSSDDQQEVSQSYDLFGKMDVLFGSPDARRLGNF